MRQRGPKALVEWSGTGSCRSPTKRRNDSRSHSAASISGSEASTVAAAAPLSNGGAGRPSGAVDVPTTAASRSQSTPVELVQPALRPTSPLERGVPYLSMHGPTPPESCRPHGGLTAQLCKGLLWERVGVRVFRAPKPEVAEAARITLRQLPLSPHFSLRHLHQVGVRGLPVEPPAPATPSRLQRRQVEPLFPSPV